MRNNIYFAKETISSKIEKERKRKEIKDDIDEFLKDGGVIKIIPTGISTSDDRISKED
jgi:hypothetical protein